MTGKIIKDGLLTSFTRVRQTKSLGDKVKSEMNTSAQKHKFYGKVQRTTVGKKINHTNQGLCKSRHAVQPPETKHGTLIAFTT